MALGLSPSKDFERHNVPALKTGIYPRFASPSVAPKEVWTPEHGFAPAPSPADAPQAPVGERTVVMGVDGVGRYALTGVKVLAKDAQRKHETKLKWRARAEATKQSARKLFRLLTLEEYRSEVPAMQEAGQEEFELRIAA